MSSGSISKDVRCRCICTTGGGSMKRATATVEQRIELVVVEEGDDANQLAFEDSRDGCRDTSRKVCGDVRGHA
jgi:hypothetical protein